MPVHTHSISDDAEGALSTLILPDATALHLHGIEIQDDTVVLNVTSMQVESACPVCGQASQQIHSAYARKPSDLALVGWRLRLSLTIRRFFCPNLNCQRKTFTERLPSVLKPYARRTQRLTEKLCGLAHALGGEAGARRSADLAIPVSPDTLLRLIRQTELPTVTTPAILGVDDFAYRKGRTYGTLLVDLEKHRVIDLLPDRTAESLAEWLKGHPGVKVISRDRSGAYADGAREGAPDAVQVADRFHLLQNLTDALEPCLSREHAHLPEITLSTPSAPGSVPAVQPSAQAPDRPAVPATDASASDTSAPESASGAPQDHDALPRRLTRVAQEKQDRRQRRHARYDEVLALHAQGLSLRSIAKQTGLARGTVRRFIRSGAFPEIRTRRKAPSRLDRFAVYLQERWQAGCHNTTQLYHEICQRGYTGSKPLVLRYLAPLRMTLPKTAHPSRAKRNACEPSADQGTLQRQISPSQGAWYMVCEPKDLKPEQQSALEQMRQSSPEIAQAHDLAQTFAQMVRDHKAEGLKDWLERAKRCGVRELRSFARGIQHDLAAVTAGLTMADVSNGQAEGQINRLKWLKRAMFGRARFDLLKHRVLMRT